MNEIEDFFNKNKNSASSSSDATQPKGRSPLVGLQKDLDFYKEAIKEVSEEIIQEGLSDYPIFIAHQHQVNVGEIILDREELGTGWTIHASTLEEFIEKNIIQEDRKEKFIQSYKDPNEFICLFVIVPEGANFVFSPYKLNEKS